MESILQQYYSSIHLSFTQDSVTTQTKQTEKEENGDDGDDDDAKSSKKNQLKEGTKCRSPLPEDY